MTRPSDREPYFPLFTDISSWKILVIGAGEIALRRLETLAHFAKEITIIAPEIHPKIKILAQNNNWKIIKKNYDKADLKAMDMVLATTNCRHINREIYLNCKELDTLSKIPNKRILVNVADRQEECDFLFPAIVQKDQHIIGISSGGKDKTGTKDLAKELREKL